MMKSNSINRRGHPEGQPHIGRNQVLAGQIPNRSIIHSYLFSVNHNEILIPIALNGCVKPSCDCSMWKNKHIGEARSLFTPIEPNWTDEPAVINDVDKQHLSGMEPKNGVFFRL